MNATKTGRIADQFDPTGEVNLEDPAAVERAIRAILDDHYGDEYDVALLAQAMRDVVAAYRGDYPGLLRCDTLYHDLRHALETGLTTARLLDGHAKSVFSHGAAPIGGERALLCVLLALFHDIGLQRRISEADIWGPSLNPVHEERGVAFMRDYLSRTSLASHAESARLIMATKLVFAMPSDWPEEDRRLASFIASADLLCQCSDRCYLEKCRDFLFAEFTAIGLAGKADSPYPDRETLLEKTPQFLTDVVRPRLDREFRGVYRLMEAHTGCGNPWTDAMEHSIGYLRDVLLAREFSRLRRRPRTFV
jgi:hypothetical protein